MRTTASPTEGSATRGLIVAWRLIEITAWSTLVASEARAPQYARSVLNRSKIRSEPISFRPVQAHLDPPF